MPRITFIKNVSDEVIYPRTHEDAVITSDGFSLSQKFKNVNDTINTNVSQINTSLNKKSDASHTHDYNTLTNIPKTFTANGGNSDTVAGKTIDDTNIGSSYIWTSKKVTDEINDVLKTISNDTIYIGADEPTIQVVWIDTDSNVLKYKFNNTWIVLGTDLTYGER